MLKSLDSSLKLSHFYTKNENLNNQQDFEINSMLEEY